MRPTWGLSLKLAWSLAVLFKTFAVETCTQKRLIMVRHGRTEMNEYLSQSPWGSPGFEDPSLWDTILTPTGISQARRLNADLINSEDISNVELVISSPLTRALMTANLAFEKVVSYSIPRVALPLAAERLYLSSDIGRNKSELMLDHKVTLLWDFSLLPDGDWWYTPDPGAVVTEWRPNDATYACPGEPEDVFRQRMSKLKKFLAERPEKTIALVAHWGVLKALTGKNFENCEMKVVDFSDLLEIANLEE